MITKVDYLVRDVVGSRVLERLQVHHLICMDAYPVVKNSLDGQFGMTTLQQSKLNGKTLSYTSMPISVPIKPAEVGTTEWVQY
jgi:hypothetical protein